MFSRSIFKTILLAAIVLAAAATAAAAAPVDQAPASIGDIHTYLMPDLSLKSTLSVSLAAVQPKGALIRKWCSCSCGTIACTSDFDCDGGSCDGFISCNCAKGTTTWLPGAELSSRQTKLPAFKQRCN